MSEQAGTAQRFTLDEARAQEWLAEPDEDLGGIGENWRATDPGNENDIYHLVRNAVDSEIIGRPDGNYDVDFEYVDDEDGGYYQFIVRIGRQIKLASYSYEMRKIDGRDETGVKAALAILHEAVGSANRVLSALDEYVASRQDTTLADEHTANGEPLPAS